MVKTAECDRLIQWFATHGEDVDYEWTSDDEDVIREGLKKIAIEKAANPYNEDGSLKVEGFLNSSAIYNDVVEKWIERSNERYKTQITELIDKAVEVEELENIEINPSYKVAPELESKKLEKLEKLKGEEILKREVGVKGGWRSENAKWAAYYRNKVYLLRDALHLGVNIQAPLEALREEVLASEKLTEKSKKSILEQIQYLSEML